MKRRALADVSNLERRARCTRLCYLFLFVFRICADQCGNLDAQKFQLGATGILFVTIVLDLYQVQSSKSLPAFFNEASEISNGLLLSLFVFAMGFAVIIVSDEPTGDPNVTYVGN